MVNKEEVTGSNEDAESQPFRVFLSKVNLLKWLVMGNSQ